MRTTPAPAKSMQTDQRGAHACLSRNSTTYPLHIIPRFEMEQDLVAGRMETRDIPEAWNAKMQDYLGLSTTDSPGDGPMQDVHWPAGLFGYFPSYSLGAMMAAQQWATIAKDIPDIEHDLANGRFERVNEWRRDHIWSQGSRWSTPELMQRATGSPLDAAHFKRHLEQRYGG